MVKFFKRLSYFLLATVMPVLVYVTGKFYVKKNLVLQEDYILLWTIIVILISISLVMSCLSLKKVEVSNKKIEKLEVQNEYLIKLVLDFQSQSENNHYENMQYMQNSREIFMDLED